MAALEEAIRQDAMSNKYLTPWIVDGYSQLGLLAELERQVDMAQPQATMWKKEAKAQDTATTAANAVQANINSIAGVILEHCQEQLLDTNEGALQGRLQSSAALDAAKDRLHSFFQPLLVKLDHTQGQTIPGDDTRPRRQIQKVLSTEAFGLLGTNIEDVFEGLSRSSSWWLGDRAYHYVTPPLSPGTTQVGDEENENPVPFGDEAESSAGDMAYGESLQDSDEGSVVSAAKDRSAVVPSIRKATEATPSATITGDKPRRFQPIDTKRSKRFRIANEAPQSKEARSDLRRHITVALPSTSPTFHGKITVDARAYRTLQVMDLAPGIAAGEVKFNEVLYALSEAGFMAEHASGVIWTVFRDGKSITFHRPHSAGPKWAKEQARGVGKHIASKWGFTKETFVEIEKGEVMDDVEGF